MNQFPLSSATKNFFAELQKLHKQTDIFAASTQPRNPEFAKVSAAVDELALSASKDLRTHLGFSGDAAINAELLKGPAAGGGADPMSAIIVVTVGCQKHYFLLDDNGNSTYLGSSGARCLGA